MKSDTQAFKPQLVIVIPNGRAVTLGQYVQAWKQVKAMPPNFLVRGWQHFETTAASVLQDISDGVDDRINKRGGIDLREPKESRILRGLERRVTVACRWCGQSMAYRPVQNRFCCAECRRDYSC